MSHAEHAVCSNRGSCDTTTGKCSCYPDFTGASCNKVASTSTMSSVTLTDIVTLTANNPAYNGSVVRLAGTGLMFLNYALLRCGTSDQTVFEVTGSGDVIMDYGGLSIHSGGQTIYGGGLAVSNGMSINNRGLNVRGGISVEGGVNVAGHLQIQSGLSVKAGGLVVDGGMSVYDDGMRVSSGGFYLKAGGMTISRGGFVVSGGISIASGGLFVTKKGMSVGQHGIVVESGGLSLVGIHSGLQLTGGVTVPSGGLYVTGGLQQNTGNFILQTVTISGKLGAGVGGMTVGGSMRLTQPAYFANGGFANAGSVTIQSGGLTATNIINIALSMTVSSSVTISGIVSGCVACNLVGNSGIYINKLLSISGLSVLGGGMTSKTLRCATCTVQGNLYISTSQMVLSKLLLSGTSRITAAAVTTASSISFSGMLSQTGNIIGLGFGGNTLSFVSVSGQVSMVTLSVPSATGNIYGSRNLNGLGGLTVFNGMYVGGSVTLRGTGSNGLATFDLTVPTLMVNGGLTSAGPVQVQSGMTVAGTGTIEVTGALTSSGGVSIMNGLTAASMSVSQWATVSSLSVSTMRVPGNVALFASGLTVGQSVMVIAGGVNSDLQAAVLNDVYASSMYVLNDVSIAAGGIEVAVGAIAVGNDVTVSSGLSIVAGGLYGLGGTTVGSGRVVGGVTIASGSVHSGAISVGGGMYVTGGLSTPGSITIGSDLSVLSGGIYTSSLGGVGDVNIASGGLTSGSGATINDGMTIESGGAYVSGSLTHLGNVASNYDSLYVSSGVSVGSGVTVSVGGAYLASTLSISGSLSVAAASVNSMSISGNLCVGGNVIVNSFGGGLEVAGDATIGGDATVYGYTYANTASFSDRRLKTNIDSILNPLQKVAHLRGVYYNWNELGTHNNTQQYMGVIAQEVAEVIPEIVHQSRDQDHFSVSYNEIIPVVLEATKDISARMDRMTESEVLLEKVRVLKQRVERLQMKHAQLLNKIDRKSC